MRDQPIIVTTSDKSTLYLILTQALAQAVGPQSHLRDLQFELARAKVVEPHEMPPDVVTMNSIVEVSDFDDGSRDTYTLVYPDQADINQGKLSIFSPVGTAILGYRVGDIIQWQVPKGMCSLRIEQVLYQPEREAQYQP